MIGILGAGESGVGAAILAKKKGLMPFVSDSSEIKQKYKEVLKNHEIASMHYVKQPIQKIEKQFQKLPLLHILVLVLLGGIVLKFTIGKPNVVTLQRGAMCTHYRIQFPW